MQKEKGLNLRPQTRRLAMTAMLGALALALSAVESMFPPLPMMPPGAKPGMSNLVTMYAAFSLGPLPALGIALLKGLFAGMLRGATALLMSTAGGIASTLVMWTMLQWNSRPFGWIGIGIGGALTHNLAQLGVAALLTTPMVAAYLPWLLVFGVVTGALTGILLRLLLPLLEKVEHQLFLE